MLRVNLGFDENDSDQAKAYAILKEHKNHKSAFLTKLILEDVARKENNTKYLTEEDFRRIIRQELIGLKIPSVEEDDENEQRESSKEERIPETKPKEKKAESKSQKEEKKKDDHSIPKSFYETNEDIDLTAMLEGFPGML